MYQFLVKQKGWVEKSLLRKHALDAGYSEKQIAISFKKLTEHVAPDYYVDVANVWGSSGSTQLRVYPMADRDKRARIKDLKWFDSLEEHKEVSK